MLQRVNALFMVAYIAAAVAISDRFAGWPDAVMARAARRAGSRGLVERMLIEHPRQLWIAIPVLLFVVNLIAMWAANRHPDEHRRRALAWIAWLMTTVSLWISGLLYAGREAAMRDDPTLFWSYLRISLWIFVPLEIGFGVMTLWVMHQSRQARRELGA